MFSNGSCTLKFRKRDTLWRNSTETCTAFIENKKDLEARSYRHWLFLTNINGLVIFNDYGYSTSTSGHQRAVRSLIKGRYKIDLEVNQRTSLDRGIDLEPFYESILLSEVKLSKKGLSENSRFNLLSDKKDAEKYIAKILKAKIAKPFSKNRLNEMKKTIESRENERLLKNRESNKAKLEALKALKPKLLDFSAVKLEVLENEMNNLNQITI